MIRQSRTAVFAETGPANGAAPRRESAQHLREDLARRQAKRNSWMVPAGAALLAAIAVFILPAWRLEAMVGATGISEMLPLAAPPLGVKARILIALVMAGFVGAVAMLFAPFLMGLIKRKAKPAPRKAETAAPVWDKADDADWDDDYDAADGSWDEDHDGYDDDDGVAEDETPAPKSAKASADQEPKKGRTSLFDRLAKLRHRGQEDAADDIRDFDDLPRLKARDAHPDAPARRPIFAHRDLGAPLDSPLETPVAAEPVEPAAQATWQQDDAHAQDIPSTDQVFGQPPLHLNNDLLAKDIAAPAPAPLVAPAPEPVMPPPYVPNWASAPVIEPAAMPEPEIVAAPVMPEPEAAVEIAPEPFKAEPMAPVAAPDLALSELTLAQLVDRLEHVLAEHQAKAVAEDVAPAPVHPLQTEATAPIAPAPVAPAEPAPLNIAPMPAPAPVAMATPAAPSPSEEEEMDRALKAALATLERMTAQR